MAVLARPIQTTWRGLEGWGPRVAGSHLSGEGHGSVRHLDALVSVAEVAAALLLTAFEYWL